MEAVGGPAGWMTGGLRVFSSPPSPHPDVSTMEYEGVRGAQCLYLSYSLPFFRDSNSFLLRVLSKLLLTMYIYSSYQSAGVYINVRYFNPH